MTRRTSRRSERTTRGAEDPRAKAKKLIELAVDKETPEKEALSAACKAVDIIHRYDLLSNPLDAFAENKTVKAAKNVVDTLSDPGLVDSLKTIGGSLREIRDQFKGRR
jgi:BRCT domain type II-containing protein